MTKQKGPKKAKMEFTVKRIERKKTRHLTGPALAEAQARIAAAKQPARKGRPKKPSNPRIPKKSLEKGGRPRMKGMKAEKS